MRWRCRVQLVRRPRRECGPEVVVVVSEAVESVVLVSLLVSIDTTFVIPTAYSDGISPTLGSSGQNCLGYLFSLSRPGGSTTTNGSCVASATESLLRRMKSPNRPWNPKSRLTWVVALWTGPRKSTRSMEMVGGYGFWDWGGVVEGSSVEGEGGKLPKCMLVTRISRQVEVDAEQSKRVQGDDG
ncbi:hypothetical protein KCU88_g26, partial [Aureobasidium melanogenum]